MGKFLILLLYVNVLLYQNGARGDSAICYGCSGIPYPRDCDRVVRCTAGSRCYTEEYVTDSGTVLYNTGCRSTARCGLNRRNVMDDESDVSVTNIDADDDTILCETCCDGDFCNSDGCNTKPLLAMDSRGPVCFNCHQQKNEDSCFSVTVCDLYEQCQLQRYRTGNGDILYTTGCTSSSKCGQGSAIGAVFVGRRQLSQCYGCCSDDYCNRNCSAVHYGVHASPSLTTGVSSPTTINQHSAPASTVFSTTPPTASTTTLSTTAQATPTTTSATTSSTTSQTTSTTMSPTTSTTTSATKSSNTLHTTTLPISSLTPSLITMPSTTQTTSPSTSQTTSSSTSSITSLPTTSIAFTQATHPTTMSPEERCNDVGYDYDATYHVCYSIQHDFKLTWHDARLDCQEDGADLIIFRSAQEEQQFVKYAKALAGARPDLNYWVGASDIYQEGYWVWLDGSQVAGRLFQDYQPDNNRGNEDCAALNRPPHDNDIRLNDETCDKPEHFICELKLKWHPTDTTSRPTSAPDTSPTTPPILVTHATLPTTISPEERCTDVGYDYDATYHVCYYLEHEFKLTWHDARLDCQGDGADLIIFRSAEEEQQFVEYAKEETRYNLNYWVGASDINQEGNWVWLDGSHVDRSLFQAYQPDNHNGNEDCAALNQPQYINDIRLNDGNCDVKEYFICQLKLSSQQTDATNRLTTGPNIAPSHGSISHPCRNSDYTYNTDTGICYKIYNTISLPQASARQRCHGDGAELLILRNGTVESEFISMHFNDHNMNHRYWLGAYRLSGHNEHVPASFRWYNGRELDPSLHWYPGEPNNQYPGESCLTFTYFTGNGGSWPFFKGSFPEFALNDDKCHDPYYFICEERCPNKAYHYDASTGLCYKLYTDQVTWSEAKRLCEQNHMDLLELENTRQLYHFQTILKENESYWIGARTSTTSTDTFEWQTLKHVVPASFRHNGMTSSSSRQCGALSHSSIDNKVAISRQDCDTTVTIHGFICQHIW